MANLKGRFFLLRWCRNVGSGGYGQNIASWGSTGDISGLTNVVAASAVTDQWYNSEALNYLWYHESSPPSGTDIDKWAHFSQLVWKSSTKLGCATVQCDAGTVLPFPSYFTVCNYGPEGRPERSSRPIPHFLLFSPSFWSLIRSLGTN